MGTRERERVPRARSLHDNRGKHRASKYTKTYLVSPTNVIGGSGVGGAQANGERGRGSEACVVVGYDDDDEMKRWALARKSSAGLRMEAARVPPDTNRTHDK